MPVPWRSNCRDSIMYRGEQNCTLSCNSKTMQAVLSKMIPGYNQGKRYKITGHFDMEGKVMYDDMSEAEESNFRAPR